MANRTGYFYIVNQSTGLVLQAVDFTSDACLQEQIEKKRQQQSFKGGQVANKPTIIGSTTTAISSATPISKGPRFYLMNKVQHQPNNGNLNNNPENSVNSDTSHEEQLW